MYGISLGSALSMIGHSTSTSISVLYIVTSFGSGVGNGLTKFSISVTLCQEGSLTECLPRQKVFVWIFILFIYLFIYVLFVVGFVIH